MLSTACCGNFLWYCGFLFLCIFLAPYSLRYHVVKHDSSRDQLQNFLSQLSFPHKLLTLNQNTSLGVTTNIVLDNLDEVKQISQGRLQFDRLPFALLLVLCTLGAIYRLSYPGQLTLDNIVGALLMVYGFSISWRFGRGLGRKK